MRLAAGGVAEEIQFGHHTYGVAGDHAKIDLVLVTGHPQASQERQNNFPDTRAILQANWPAVVRLAEITLRRFRPMNLDNVAFPNTPALSANATSRIFTNPQLTQQEHAIAQLKAFLYAQERGKGSDPEYQQHLAVEDFEKAAGDVFGELQ